MSAPSETLARVAVLMTMLTAPVTAERTVDAVFANWDDHADETCLGNGAGGFTCALVAAPGSYDVAITEVNGDDHRDLILAKFLGDNVVCLGDGTGAFAECSTIPGSGPGSYGVTAGRLSSDVYVDLVFANSDLGQPENRVCLGDGDGGFSCSDVSADTEDSFDVALGSLGGSNFRDVVFASNGANRICLGDGQGGFGPCSPISGNTDFSVAVAVGDIEGDGDQDVVFANLLSIDRICYRSGNAFNCSNLPLTPSIQADDVALGDLDNTSRLDAVFADAEGRSRVCLEVGTNTACSDVFSEDRVAIGVALGLIDGDLRPDAVFAMADGPAEVCLNDGLGHLTCSPIGTAVVDSRRVALADLETLIFADGFESGDTSAWSTTSP